MRPFKTLATALKAVCRPALLQAAIGCSAALVVALPVTAQQVLAVYDAEISPRDRNNSSGKRLGHFCAVIQQDRAHYHRFGKRDSGDQGDLIFSDPAMRAQISSTCEMVRGHEFLHDLIMGLPNASATIRVRVLQDAGKLRVLVSDPTWGN